MTGWKYLRYSNSETPDEFGPYSDAQIADLARQRVILRETYIGHAEKTRGKWVAADKIPALKKIFDELGPIAATQAASPFAPVQQPQMVVIHQQAPKQGPGFLQAMQGCSGGLLILGILLMIIGAFVMFIFCCGGLGLAAGS